MIITCHWSATGPTRINDYHVEFGLNKALPTHLNATLMATNDQSKVDWALLKSCFNIWKNVDFDTVTSYGTWHLNSDPRDKTSNIELGALCMGGESVQVTGPWGNYPFTYAHAWLMAGIAARVAYLKEIDVGASFPDSVSPGQLQNGPIFNLSTHGERALQTNDDGEDKVAALGYFAYSGDPDCRWDLSALDVSEAHLLNNATNAVAQCKKSANWIRDKAHQIKLSLNEKSDMWGLDKDPVA